MNYSNIPYELRSLPQWCLWSYVERDGKLSKVPFQTDGKMALANTPSTWSSFAAVEYVQREKGFEGIGFMFSKDDEYIGIDIDKCMDENGNLNEFANNIIERLDSYTEFSPSGKRCSHHHQRSASILYKRHREKVSQAWFRDLSKRPLFHYDRRYRKRKRYL